MLGKAGLFHLLKDIPLLGRCSFSFDIRRAKEGVKAKEREECVNARVNVTAGVRAQAGNYVIRLQLISRTK